ncbi:Rv3654c family TadE-like protein [Corynebacterium timonense]|uniref:Helicase/secretion neighborhood TadE-like protein n=1 Tax=Corynebacterium timonense TaxID=441500 RepID=A0A1H1TJ90_9CORY|nr:Rv3654c family TadE-like protein [Corynebacterium timonense]SDS60141.1 helicase/secretion neighborhood TadE-like protein [Corynebacterium timonense]
MRRGHGPRAYADDAGYATVMSVGIIAAVVSLMLAVVGAGAHVATTHRARTAADLAAVAGATAFYEGADACQAARQAAELNGARVELCQERAPDVVVEVSLGRASAQARAGPL